MEEEKKRKRKRKGKKEANIASADRSDGVGLARPASVVGKKTYLLAERRPCDWCWPATINHLRSRGRPQTPNPAAAARLGCGSVVGEERGGEERRGDAHTQPAERHHQL
ncbi:hypothetical protein EYF80_066421 [Liparis tanakae]|uniref:Uncharacterized protein n=1 Tax=Liparis tanakae TaxID=230148 RepID=A0A4Z2E3Y7_9TELE|nr:hypothetical protein EYF80_066421 [Liparis tanakae]